jgi:hypothetical protein
VDIQAGVAMVKAQIQAATPIALSSAAEYLLAKAVEIVPIEEGSLSRSGRTEVDGDTAAIGFGSGPSAAYAARQHEDLSYHHDNGRQAHFLSGPVNSPANHAAILQFLANEIGQAM